jgi:hypothetical protein
MNKNRWIIIISYLFIGCSQQQPIVVNTPHTPVTKVDGHVVTAMPHQSCYDNGEYLVCTSANGNQVAFKKDSCFGRGYAGISSSGSIDTKELPSKCETATGVLVKTYPYIRALTNFFKNK